MSPGNKCGAKNTHTPLSVGTAVTSGAIMIPTIMFNSLLIYGIIKVRRGKLSFFYKLLLNIAIADLMTGLIVNPIAINFLTKEALKIPFSMAEIYADHLAIFFTDAVALITMTFLSFDRIAALLYPIKYHNGMKARNENIIVGMIYPLAIVLVIPYFKVKFIIQLAFFTSLNIALAIISLVATILVFQHAERKKKQGMTHGENHTDTGDGNADKETAATTSMHKKVTKTFLIMVSVFAVVYLPTCVTMIYMNSCGNGCDCFIVHVMRDVSGLSIISSSVFRPLIYLLTIQQLRKAMLRPCQREKQNTFSLINSGTSGSAST